MKRKDLKQVRSLREAGYSYSRIAAVLGVPKNSVKSYCNRFGIQLGSGSPDSSTDGKLRCTQCGKAVEYKHQSAIKRFCSKVCRMRWWNAHRDHATSKAAKITVCANCGKAFQSYPGEHRKYCCHACYIIDRFGKGATHD